MTSNPDHRYLECTSASRPVDQQVIEYGYSFDCGGWISNDELLQWKKDTGYCINTCYVGTKRRKLALVFPDQTEMTLFKMKFGITLAAHK